MKACAWTIALLLAFAAPSAAQRTSVGRDFPIYDNGGLPDLTIDPQRFTSQMEIVDRLFDPIKDECAFEEGVIGGEGYRRLLRFDTVIINAGDGLSARTRRPPLTICGSWTCSAIRTSHCSPACGSCVPT